MSLSKEIDIQVLRDTWPDGSLPPVALLNAENAGPYVINVLCALLFTGLWTRPPVSYGFSLSDCWAWLRYFPAICGSQKLKLCEEWTSLDPHHKTVLSGDFGVGFTTWFLHQSLGFVSYSDTLWVVNTLHPGLFELGGSTRRGPSKSPDFIAQDRYGNISVLECKGTQSSRRSLSEAVQRGVPQKGNLKAIGSTTIQHSLVAGLFVPQSENEENATLMVADPDWQDVKEKLAKFSKDEVGRGISQIAFAKELAMHDLSETANSLARAKASASDITVAFKEDSARIAGERRAQRRVRLVGGEVKSQREYHWPKPMRISDNLLISGVRFEGTLPDFEVEKLLTMVSPSEHGDSKRENIKGGEWKLNNESSSEISIQSPLGSIFRLLLLEGKERP